MIYWLHTIGCSLMVFALVIYLTNFKEVNKEFKVRWRWALQNTRETYYEMFYPYGYYIMKQVPGTDIWYQHKYTPNYHRDVLYNRKMMKK